jgi:hypothetical protein
MKRGDWIVCERTSRWAAGLRSTAARQVILREGSAPRIIEVRSLGELGARLNEQPILFAFVEVNAGNLAVVLAWIADAQVRHPYARFIALLNQPPIMRKENWPATPGELAHDVVSVLLEAGAVGVADSPRHLHEVPAIAERYQALVAVDFASSPSDQPLIEWARSLLPWQDE